MAFSNSRRYVGYVAALGVSVMTMMNASASEKQAFFADKLKYETPNNLSSSTQANAQQVQALAPAAGEATADAASKPAATKEKAAKKPVAKKKAAKKKTAKKMNDDAIDDASDTAYDSDPIEPLNRAIFQFNYGVDTVLLRPVTQGYRFVVPQDGRTAVTHFLENLYSPVTFVNSVLQGDPENSFATLWRFILNTTFGLGGIHDFASEAGLKNRTTDLGETFAIYGADAGPYLVIPIMGPSGVRDGLGKLGDVFFFPPNYADEWAVPLTIGAVTAIDARSNNMEVIDGVYKSSLDPYATFRSAYTQKRAESIRRAKAARNAALDKAAAAH